MTQLYRLRTVDFIKENNGKRGIFSCNYKVNDCGDMNVKKKIKEASIRLFERKGFAETSIQDIVDSIGVTKGTFYYYFTSKEELLMDIHLSYIDDILATQEKILADETKNCKEKLFEIVHMLVSRVHTHGASAKIFFREMKNLNEERLAKILPKRDQFRFNIEKLISEGIEIGEFRKGLNCSIITFAILGITNWSYQWFNAKGSLSDYEISEIFIDMIFQGIVPK